MTRSTSCSAKCRRSTRRRCRRSSGRRPRTRTSGPFSTGCSRRPAQQLALAWAGETPVGYVQYFAGERPEDLYQPARKFAYIHQLAVADGHRRSGYGSALIGHVKARARAQGIARVGIDFWSFNGAARACFQRQGFAVNQEFMWLSV